MRRLRWWLTALLASTSFALAASPDEWKACEGTDFSKAIAACTRIATRSAETAVDRADAYRIRGIAYGRKGEHERALADFDQAIKLKPNDPNGYYNRGMAYGHKYDHDRAIADFDQVIRLKPNDPNGYHNRGVAYDNKGQHDRAIADFDQAIKLRPNYPDAYSNRGIAYNGKGEFDRAIADFDQAIKLNPNNPDGYYSRGLAHGVKGEQDRAIADFDQAIKLNPNDPNALHSRGLAYGQKGEHDRAIADFDHAIKLKPNDPDAFHSRGIAYGAKGEYDRAIADLDQAIKLKPDASDAFTTRGYAYDSKGEHDRAIADYNQAIKLDPKDADAFYNRGISYQDKGEYNRAIADFDKAIELGPNNSAARYARGLAYLEKGDRQRAIRDYTVAEMLPSEKQSPFGREKQKQAQEALKALLDASQEPAVLPNSPAPQLKRYALLIGNSAYKAVTPLDSPLRDIAAVEKGLRALGFQVIVHHDLNQNALRSAFRQFDALLRKQNPDWALVYFSGHGTETINGAWMLPTDILVEKDGEEISDVTIEEDAVSIQNALLRLQAASTLRLVIYDACRDNPVLSRFNRVIQQAKSGSLGGNRATGLGWGHDGVIFATAPGTFAFDGAPGALSPFAKSFVAAIAVEGLELKQLVARIRDEVKAATAAARVVPQLPDVRGFPLEGEHYFNPAKPQKRQ